MNYLIQKANKYKVCFVTETQQISKPSKLLPRK